MTVLISDVLFNFLTYIESLGFESEPDYDKCRAMFKDALKKAKHPMVSRLLASRTAALMFLGDIPGLYLSRS